MTYVRVTGLPPQYQKNDGTIASGYYLKFYAEGTTTAIKMATNETGGTKLDKCLINTSGYPVNGSSAVFIPHINQDYKAVLYKTEEDANSDTTANADWVVDNLKTIGVNDAISVTNITALKALDATIYLYAQTMGYSTAKDGGHGFYYFVNGDATTADDATVIADDAGAGRWFLLPGDNINVKQFGAKGDDSTDDSPAIVAAIDYICNGNNPKTLHFPDGTYLFNTPKGSQFGSGTDRSITMTFSASATIKRSTDGPEGSSVQCFDFGGTASVVKIIGMNFYGSRDTLLQAYIDNGLVSSVKVIGPDRRINVIRTNGCQNVIIENCFFREVHGNVVAINSADYAAVKNTRVETCSGNCIKFTSCEAAIAEGNSIENVGLVPDTFTVDGVAATLNDGDNWHMQFGDGISFNETSNGIATGNKFKNISRIPCLAEALTDLNLIATFTDNIVINNNDNLKCGNPHGAFWVEGCQAANIENNINLEVLRNVNETIYRGIVIAPAKTGQTHETFIVSNNMMVVYDYRTSASNDLCLQAINPINSGYSSVTIQDNTFVRLGTNQQGQTCLIYQSSGGVGGVLKINNNLIYQEGNTAGTSALNFNVDTSARTWFEEIQIHDNVIHSPNKPALAANSDYSIRFDVAANYTNMKLSIKDNMMVGDVDGIYLSAFDGDEVICTGNKLAGFDFDFEANNYVKVDDNIIFGGYINEFQVTGAALMSSFSNNQHYGRLDINNPVDKLVVKGNSFQTDSTNGVGLILGGTSTGVSIEDNYFLANADAQECIRVVASANLTRCSISKNTFDSGGYSAVGSINWVGAGSAVGSVVGGNIDLGTVEQGSAAPRNVGI